MQKVSYVCDRCGKEYFDNMKPPNKTKEYVMLTTYKDMCFTYAYDNEKDLCPECFNEMQEWFYEYKKRSNNA